MAAFTGVPPGRLSLFSLSITVSVTRWAWAARRGARRWPPSPACPLGASPSSHCLSLCQLPGGPGQHGEGHAGGRLHQRAPWAPLPLLTVCHCVSYQVGLGSTAGGTQVAAFTSVPPGRLSLFSLSVTVSVTRWAWAARRGARRWPPSPVCPLDASPSSHCLSLCQLPGGPGQHDEGHAGGRLHRRAPWRPLPLFTVCHCVSYQVGLGSTAGGTQVAAFTGVPPGRLSLIVRGLDLSRVTRVFATVKAFNAAGLYSTVTSNGVYVSLVSSGMPSLRQSVVHDGDRDGDAYVTLQQTTSVVFLLFL